MLLTVTVYVVDSPRVTVLDAGVTLIVKSDGGTTAGDEKTTGGETVAGAGEAGGVPSLPAGSSTFSRWLSLSVV
jgi:hypothetical protein